VKNLLILFCLVFVLSGCATHPATNPVKESGRRMGAGVYKTAEGEVYRKVDGAVSNTTRQIINLAF
jgi:hypothetical protein